MNDWGLSLLGRYPVTVTGTKKVRGALLCDTKEGQYLLQEYKGSENRLLLEAKCLQYLKEETKYLVDAIVCNQEGMLFCKAEDGCKYILKCWYPYTECNTADREELLLAMRQLGRIHIALKQMSIVQEDRIGMNTENTDLEQIYEKHNKELRHVYRYLLKKKKKNAIEEQILKSWESAYGQAEAALERLQHSKYQALRKQAIESHCFCHGAYHQHNVLIQGNEIAIVNFEHMSCNLCIMDVYQFMRKIVEKHNWNYKLGELLLDEYHKVTGMSTEERKILQILFAYPEKYWKQVNFYFNNKKGWTSEKNMEKLLLAVRQQQMRKEWLKIF